MSEKKSNETNTGKEYLFTHVDGEMGRQEIKKRATAPQKLFTRLGEIPEKTCQNTVNPEMQEEEMKGVENVKRVALEKKYLFTRVNERDEESVHIPGINTKGNIEGDLVTQRDTKSLTSIIKAQDLGENDTNVYKNFELILKKILVKIFDTKNGEEEEYWYIWSIRIKNLLYEASVLSDDVHKFGWVKRATKGIAVFRSESKIYTFETWISNLIMGSSVSKEFCYSSNGWKNLNGQNLYVYDGGCIGQKNRGIRGNGGLCFSYQKEAIGTLSTFQNALGMLNICEDKRITLPLFLFTHAGVITKIFNESGYPIKFMVAVIGETNSRKTSMSLCLTKIFNRQDIQKPEVTFSSPAGGIEVAINKHADSVLVIDDFMPALTTSRQKTLDDKLEKITRMYGDGKGIERMSDFAKKPNAGYYPVKGLGIITGEHIHGVLSSLTRHLIVSVNRKSVDNVLLAFYQKNYKILTTHIYDFISWVAERYDYIAEFIAEKMGVYRMTSLFEFPRYDEMCAVFLTTVEIFLAYAKDRGFLNDEQVEYTYIAWKSITVDVIRENERALKSQDLGETLREVCRVMYESGQAEPLPKQEDPNYGNRIFVDNLHLYVRLDTFLDKVKKSLMLWGIEWANYSKHAVLDELEKKGILDVGRKSEGKRTAKLPGSKKNQQRFLHIRLDKILDKGEER